MNWKQGSFGLHSLHLWHLKSMLAISKYCQEHDVDWNVRNEACRILSLAMARYEVDILERPLDDLIHRVDLTAFANHTAYNIEKKLQDGKTPDKSDIVDIVARWEDLRKAAE